MLLEREMIYIDKSMYRCICSSITTHHHKIVGQQKSVKTPTFCSCAANTVCFESNVIPLSLGYTLNSYRPIMMLRVLPDLCHKSSAFQSIVRRCFSKSSSTYRDNDKVNDDISLPGHDGENGCASKEKFPYPEISVKSTLISFPYDNEENPFVRTGKALKFDFDVAKARIQGRPPPPTPVESDIVIIGGGVVGSSIAHHLSERCGPGLNISVVEMDSPYLSTSLRVGRNDLYQQVNLKPNVEMALYAAEYYRKLCKHQNPDLPQMSIDFQPNSSLCLASAEGAAELEDRAEMYRELDWRHQLLTPSLLKERFPWMNMDGVAVGCLGLNREGICNKLKAVSAMRARAKQVGVNFIEGKLVGFQFIDQTDLLTGYEQQARYYAPRRVVIQSKTGELSRLTFGYLILAAGVSIQDLLHKINIAQVSMNVPIEAEERFAFNFVCPNGPGIEMPMIMESGGFRFRKADIVNSYTVWEEQSPSKEVPKNYSMDSMNTYFSENILPRLIQRVPSFKDAKLTSFDHGLVDVCTWDNNLFVGPVLGFYNVLQTGGFGNDEFLYAPAVGRGMAELILDREFEALDLSCFRHERTAENVKINEVLDSFLRHNSNIPKQ